MKQITVYASAARTATPTAVIFSMRHATAVRIMMDVTAITATPSIVVTVEVQDVLSGKWCLVRTETAVTTVSTNAFAIIQGLVGNVRVTATHADADSATYSMSAHLTR